ncbi:hypothetical protein Bca52824_067913, partial [Brassica carinata]
VVAVSDTRGQALIKLIPRIDMAAMTQKYLSCVLHMFCSLSYVAAQKGLNPAPRLISSSELEDFRPLIQVRRDRDTGMTFEHLDSHWQREWEKRRITGRKDFGLFVGVDDKGDGYKMLAKSSHTDSSSPVDLLLSRLRNGLRGMRIVPYLKRP